ncbi:hypothetical protein FHETE_861 [Fusarium heterosporum]|uniref:Uncharacterized protein n=1 Tax=Fusarium heterosporum TaxID=42747 RepID=A0A8H5X359_FUSHE|nr:hypothetical protein FHETE_861 [Fusarium heterosporum]
MTGSSSQSETTYGTYIHNVPAALLHDHEGVKVLKDALAEVYPNGVTCTQSGDSITVIATNSSSSEPVNLTQFLQDCGALKQNLEERDEVTE